MNQERVTIAVNEGVADVRLARPEKRNALDPAMFEALRAAIATLEATPGLRAVVLSGEGKAFSAGMDLASFSPADVGDIRVRTHGLANGWQAIAWGWRTLAVPVVAAVHGVAFGGGLQLLSGADIKIAAPNTRFSVMEMKWGLVPDMGGMALWRTTVRDDILRELTYTAREFLTDEAIAFGFVTRSAEDPRAEALSLARSIAARSPTAVRAAKRLINAMADEDAAALLHAESDEQSRILFRANQIEALQANLTSRAPVFTDDE